MRVLVEHGEHCLTKKLQTRDVILVPDFYPNFDVYKKLVDEVSNCGDILKPWHGSTHQIADDKSTWKEKCPTFNEVVKRIQDYFKMKISSTRLNWYPTDEDWKPFHRDRAGLYEETAKTQNFTVAVSFGSEREAVFEEEESKKVISFPCPCGSAYAFTRDINTLWKHGIKQIPPEKRTGKGRISVIVWGWADQEEV